MAADSPSVRIRLFVLLSAIMIAGCDASSETPAERSPQASAPGQQGQPAEPPAPPTAPACPPTARLAGPGTPPDLQGTGDGATLWAMPFAKVQEPELAAGKELK